MCRRFDSAPRHHPALLPALLPAFLPALFIAAERLGAGPQRIADPSGPGLAFRPRTPERRPLGDGSGGDDDRERKVSAAAACRRRSWFRRGARATADRCAVARRRFVGRRAGRPPRPGAGGGRRRGDREGEVTAVSVVFPDCGREPETPGGDRPRLVGDSPDSGPASRSEPGPAAGGCPRTTGKVSAGSRGAGDRSRLRRVPEDAGDTRPPRGLLVVGDPPDRGPAAPTRRR